MESLNSLLWAELTLHKNPGFTFASCVQRVVERFALFTCSASAGHQLVLVVVLGKKLK